MFLMVVLSMWLDEDKVLLKAICSFFRKQLYKYQWFQRKIGLKMFTKRERVYSTESGFIDNEDREVKYGKQYHRLYFLGKVD